MNSLRPGSSWNVNRLGVALSLAGEFGEALTMFRRAVELEPANGSLRHNLARALTSAGLHGEAEAVCRQGIAAYPADSLSYHALGLMFVSEGRLEEAIAMYRQSLARRPGDVGAHGDLGLTLAMAGHTDEAISVFRETIRLKPSHSTAHQGLAQAYLKLGRYKEAVNEFQWVIRHSEANKNGAAALATPTLDGRYVDARLGIVKAMLCLGCFTEARDAASSALGLEELTEPQRRALERQSAICRLLGPLQARLPAVVAGTDTSADLATQRALAKWLYLYRGDNVASARLYDRVFAGQPALENDLDAQDRYYAGCAAMLAGCGVGKESAKLNERDKAALRSKALQRLSADCAAWEKRYTKRGAQRGRAGQAMHAWEECADLACIRTQAALAQLPADERIGWQNLWTRVRTIAACDPDTVLNEARADVMRRQWAKAAEAYAELIDNGHAIDGEVAFERAAVQLLAGDRAGYARSCKAMLRIAAAGHIRNYLAARACTLAPDSVADATLPARMTAPELLVASGAFWALSEQGALQYRAHRYDEAVPLFEQSMEVQPAPGCAVLNWLWLALAHQQLGHRDQARAWLKKASTWLDVLDHESPETASYMIMHRHNWLEAHVLRQEAESLIRSAPGKN